MYFLQMGCLPGVTVVELEGSGSSAGSTEPGDDVDGDDDDTAMF